METEVAGQVDVERFAQQFDQLAHNVGLFIKGKPNRIRLALVCLTSEGHLLIDDYPGVGKTSLARAIAQSVRGTVNRIQFTPDLLPSDVTGVQIYNSGTGVFDFHKGPIFANVVLGDEINRASPKTQSALLQIMEEREVSVDGITYTPPLPFIVIATQNPVELDGTYNLPEAQLDRFMMKISMGYPDPKDEVEILKDRTTGGEVTSLKPVTTVEDVAMMTSVAKRVRVPTSVHEYIVSLAGATRSLEGVRLGVSPRGALSLAQASQAFAASTGRSVVTVDHVKEMAPNVLSHRLLLTADAEIQGFDARSMIQDVVRRLAVPSEPSAV